MVYGNLTRDPEMKALPSGANVTNMSIATNRVYNDKDGNKQEEVEFHNIVVFGKQAENVSKYLTIGSSAFVEGRLQTRSWDKDGTKMYRTEIIADSVQFGPKSGSNSEERQAPDTNDSSQYPAEASDINDSGIPF